MSSTDSMVVSVVIVNFRGPEDTISAVRALREDLDWDQGRLEVIVVENGSGDDSAEILRQRLGERERLVVSSENLGFAGGSNLGVRSSTGDVVAFLNPDARPRREWVAAAARRFSDPSVDAVASRVLDETGDLVDYIGSAMTWFGMAYKPYVSRPEPRRRDDPEEVLFGTGAAMFVRRTAFDDVGGFDERYFMFYEDVDFGWRLNLTGRRFVYEPSSVVHHRHHVSMADFGGFQERFLLERNALFTLFKNLDEPALGDTIAGAMALAVRRGVALGGADSGSFDLRSPVDGSPRQLISRDVLASTFAIDRFVDALPWLRVERARIQSTRAVPESKIRTLFGEVDEPVLRDPYFIDGYERIVDAFGVVTPAARQRVLVITGDPLGAKLAGPAIRAWRISEALSEVADVVLVSTEAIRENLPDSPFEVRFVRAGDHRALEPILDAVDVVVFQGHALEWFPEIGAPGRVLVADVYDPMHLEQLEQARDEPEGIWAQRVAVATELLNRQLARADFVLCASERQRTFYLGQLAALGRVSVANYADDPFLDRLIAVVPFGLDSDPPRHTRDAIRGVVPGISKTDRVLLWAGGIYNWFDPVTLVEAVGILASTRDDVRLFFLGTAHPHPGVPQMRVLNETMDRARDLGLLDSAVFFNEGWVAFSDRQNYLLEADLGVSTHRAHLETEYSFRTRVLDYLWAGLPMVVTEGDVFGELVTREGLGAAVPAGDARALASAIAEFLDDADRLEAAHRAVERVRERFEWRRVLVPLVEFVRSAAPASDRRGISVGARAPRRRRSDAWGRDVAKFLLYVREAGVSTAVARGSAAVRRRVRSRLQR